MLTQIGKILISMRTDIDFKTAFEVFGCLIAIGLIAITYSKMKIQDEKNNHKSPKNER